ncbi:MAG: hypothetical protein GY835_24670 [bacterium]|nr:hypothetical protein [bacterium]
MKDKIDRAIAYDEDDFEPPAQADLSDEHDYDDPVAADDYPGPGGYKAIAPPEPWPSPLAGRKKAE